MERIETPQHIMLVLPARPFYIIGGYIMNIEEQKKLEEGANAKPNESGKDNPSKGTDVNDYLTAIKELKEKSVSKDEYEKVLAERRELIKAVSEGNTNKSIDVDTTKKETSSEIAKRLSENKYKNNLEGWKDALAYRDACIEEGKPDPFTPYNSKEGVKSSDIEKAEKVANAIKECVDNASDDPRIFNGNLGRKLGQ